MGAKTYTNCPFGGQGKKTFLGKSMYCEGYTGKRKQEFSNYCKDCSENVKNVTFYHPQFSRISILRSKFTPEGLVEKTIVFT